MRMCVEREQRRNLQVCGEVTSALPEDGLRPESRPVAHVLVVIWPCLRAPTRRVANAVLPRLTPYNHRNAPSHPHSTYTPLTMAKRRAVAESDDEGGSEHHSKRSRTTETDDEEQEQPRAPRRSNKGKGKERARAVGSDMEDDDDGDDMDEVAPDEDEEKKFEEEHEERIRERLMNKSKTQGVSGFF